MASTCKQLKDAIKVEREVSGIITEGNLAGQTATVQLWEGKYGRRFVVIRWQDGSRYCKRFSGRNAPKAGEFYSINTNCLQVPA